MGCRSITELHAYMFQHSLKPRGNPPPSTFFWEMMLQTDSNSSSGEARVLEEPDTATIYAAPLCQLHFKPLHSSLLRPVH